METHAHIPLAARRMLAFAYDGESRRIMKKVWHGGAGGAWELQYELRFVHEMGGWNLLAELNPAGLPLRTHAWGIDLSGTLGGAGGVGGLLFTRIPASGAALAVGMDLNGNVSLLVDMVHGRTRAHYEYGPFGEPLRRSGDHARLNPFRFSTKYTDDETGLLDYGYRYYDPATGRWPSRDPIGEEGGINLYGFVGNNGVNNQDFLGLDFIAIGSNAAIPGIPATVGGHFSITLWRDSKHCIKEGDRKTGTMQGSQADWTRFTGTSRSRRTISVPNDAKFEEVIELHFEDDFRYTDTIPGRGPNRGPKRVSLSRVQRSTLGDNADFFVVIHADNKIKNTDLKREIIKITSELYKYAEHDPFTLGAKARNYPNSKYGFLHDGNSNNSNTFIRHLARSIGKSADVIPGRIHPGNDFPVPQTSSRNAPVYVGP